MIPLSSSSRVQNTRLISRRMARTPGRSHYSVPGIGFGGTSELRVQQRASCEASRHTNNYGYGDRRCGTIAREDGAGNSTGALEIIAYHELRVVPVLTQSNCTTPPPRHYRCPMIHAVFSVIDLLYTKPLMTSPNQQPDIYKQVESSADETHKWKMGCRRHNLLECFLAHFRQDMGLGRSDLL